MEGRAGWTKIASFGNRRSSRLVIAMGSLNPSLMASSIEPALGLRFILQFVPEM